jgi:hypothetical protein
MKFDVKEKKCKNVGWIQLVQGTVQWQAHINTIMVL